MANWALDVGINHLTNADLKVLGEFKHLTSLELYLNRGITDAGLKDLAPLKELRKLNLTGTSITDAGLKELKALKQLTTLQLIRVRVTDAGMNELKDLKQLKVLRLINSAITDAGLSEIQGLVNLETLEVSGASRMPVSASSKGSRA